ncbi:MAG: YebC/PmpR family DNA-binding transcriptional regulator [bacterium]|nr:YebC/PmpR family DNA-binding transcriptional regulator [Chloroflexota bacterium]NBO51962.1 YebC/PmpR family DNA-binding transcriptional regulator [Candidatus Aquidulcis sp.]
MSGHSKWSTIKRAKGATDAKRAAQFTKVSREITIAARIGGPDPASNPRLRLAIDKGRGLNMPNDNIKRAIERAAGLGQSEAYEEITYEGYGPGGVAVLVEAATDNRNRTASEVRSLFTKAGGALASSGAVAWQFEARGVIECSGKFDAVGEAAIEAGAADVEADGEGVLVYAEPHEVHAVRAALEAAGVAVNAAEIGIVAKSTVEISADDARKTLKLIDALEELDDVQRVTANFEVPPEVFAEIAG